MKKCKQCEYWRPLENDPKKGVCTNPERNDKVMVHYFGSLKADDYCTKFSEWKSNEGETKNHEADLCSERKS